MIVDLSRQQRKTQTRCTGGTRKPLQSAPLSPFPITNHHPSDLSKLRKANESFLSALAPEERDRHLVEIYVLAEANWLRTQPTVAKAIADRGLKIHSFVFDKEKEKTVQLVEEESKDESNQNEVEITSPWKRSREANSESRAPNESGNLCTGSCGGMGLCKKAKENGQRYAF